MAHPVFLIAWLLADDHHEWSTRAFTEHRLGSEPPEMTAPTARRGATERRKGRSRG
jgi:hypothetical protein